ncbi:nucleotidyltransferase domain-containing protein [Tahibacter soli]|uniref:Nucleotidyltransferase n=1 Tax=Tahibacter soli TaxID=2983605 RepID=A0A9X3YJN1_9GAMM|nr:nucleotidyltransferase [Tahibacter soli]MDC8012797.1 nucleotidyltransferase [Tahibacter soli]
MAVVNLPPTSPLATALDVLLANIAIRIQLAPSHYKLAVERYGTVNTWIEREGSPLKDRVQLFYAQGSMATGSTIASKLRTDEYDIDVIAELDIPETTPPHQVLNLLEQAIRGERGSRYFDMTTRCTRCIQIQYADNMHLDVTPLIRQPQLSERCGNISHAKNRFALVGDKFVLANPYGFAEWFNTKTPPELEFSKLFAEQEVVYGREMLLTKAAEAEPVPDQTPAHKKSKAVIALQLLKRWRNVRYDTRNGRRPPSVMLAKLVADSANRTTTLSEEMLFQARALQAFFEAAEIKHRLIEVRNPACDKDVFSDRWPEAATDQRVFIADLHDLVRKLERLVAGVSLGTMRTILAELFGENATADVVEAFNRATGNAITKGQSYHNPGSGSFGLAASGVAAGSARAGSISTPSHTNFGSD